MQLRPLGFRSCLDAYDGQARELLDAFHGGDPDAIQTVWHRHPRFLSETVAWLPKRLSMDDVRNAPFDHADAQLTVARWYNFLDWAALGHYVDEVTANDSPTSRFETGVEAVIEGDLAGLRALLNADPGLIRARSTRVTNFDPPVHGATLLHYIAANGVEGYRQKTPPNAVDIATALLAAGAEVDALAGMYGGPCTTMSMLVSSTPPDRAGLQTALAETLLDFGADVNGSGEGQWTSPLVTALVFGFRRTADMLASRGARVDTLTAAAGLGRLEAVRSRLATATAADRHRAFALAAQLGQVEIVRLMLDAGEDPNRYNPGGFHQHATPLHQAVSSDREGVVRLLVERGARLDIRDAIFDGTPLDWAVYCEKRAIADYLRAQRAS